MKTKDSKGKTHHRMMPSASCAIVEAGCRRGRGPPSIPLAQSTRNCASKGCMPLSVSAGRRSATIWYAGPASESPPPASAKDTWYSAERKSLSYTWYRKIIFVLNLV